MAGASTPGGHGGLQGFSGGLLWGGRGPALGMCHLPLPLMRGVMPWGGWMTLLAWMSLFSHPTAKAQGQGLGLEVRADPFPDIPTLMLPQADGDRTKANGLKLKEERFRGDIGKELFP